MLEATIFFQTATRPALRKYYTVAGRFLLVEALDDWSAKVFSSLLDGWYFTHVEAGEAPAPDATIRVGRGLSPPRIPHGLPSFGLPGEGICHSDGHIFFMEFGKSLVTAGDGSPREVGVWFGVDVEDASHTLAGVVSCAVSTALRRCGVFELHSGGVCEPSGGRGALIIGASGSGKSTTTLRLAASGWGYLSDDVMLLKESAEGVEARGLRRDFALTEETLGASGINHSRPASSDRNDFDVNKRRLPPEELFPFGHVESCLPAALFFNVITNETASRVEEISAAEAMPRLIRMCPWASYDRYSAGEHLRVLARLAKQSRAFVLQAGRDLLLDADLAARLFLARV